MAFRRTDSRACWPPARARLLALAALLVLLAGLLIPAQRALAAPTLTVNLLTWNVIGLDSNRVTTGPNEYPVGVRVCNTSAAETATNVNATFNWDPLDLTPSAYINLKDSPTVTLPTLAPTACFDFYWTIVVTRDAAAYLTSRDYFITVAADGVLPVSTPRPRELYVEKILSQSRNSVLGITGPTTVYIGETYQYTLNSDTAPQGYEQLTTFVNFPNTIFQPSSIATSYTAPAGATNTTVYADACGWQPNPLLPNYNSCVGPPKYTGGKVGGTIQTTYSVKITGAGTSTMSNLIFDKSGSSYHYNADYGQAPNNLITITAVSPVIATKTDAVVIDADNNGTISAGDTLEYRVTITNTSPQTASGVSFSDPLDPNTTLVVGSVVASQGTITSGNTAGQTSVAVNVGAMAAGAQVTISYRATIKAGVPNGTTISNQGTLYNNLVQAIITDDPDAAGAANPTTTMIGAPTAVNLAGFSATDELSAVVLRWTTTVEQDSWGFHIYRSPDGTQKTAVQMTSAPIMAQGRGSEGASYSWTDSTVVPGSTYSYWLVELDMQGNKTWYGPVSVLTHYKAFLPLSK